MRTVTVPPTVLPFTGLIKATVGGESGSCCADADAPRSIVIRTAAVLIVSPF
jgi:hypothetical protein